MELSEFLELVLLGLLGRIVTVADHVNVIVTRLVKDKLCLCNQHVWALKVLQDLELVLVDGLHELQRPKPDIVELVHQ